MMTDTSASIIDAEKKKRIRWIVFSIALTVFMVRLHSLVMFFFSIIVI